MTGLALANKQSQLKSHRVKDQVHRIERGRIGEDSIEYGFAFPVIIHQSNSPALDPLANT